MSEIREIAEPAKGSGQKANEAASEAIDARSALAEGAFKPRVNFVGDRAELLDTEPTPQGKRIGPSDPNADMTITIMAKSKGTEQEIDQTIALIMSGKQKPLTDAEFEARFGADPDSVKRIEQFAKDNGLSIESKDSRSGKIELKGTVSQLSSAFKVGIEDYKDGNELTRERTGTISVPRSVASDIQGVFGLDSGKAAEPYYRKLPKGIQPRVAQSHLPNEVADLYNFPKQSMGKGQSVAILQFGGGLDRFDNSQYYANHNLPLPDIQTVGVSGAKSSPGSLYDNEVALDSQVIGAVAPEAKQQLIFAPNSEQGFVDAITRATFPEEGEIQNTAISISWGAPEVSWSDQAKQNLNLAFKKAALKGISVFAAAGDDGAKNRSPDGRFNADYPSSDPFVTGCGGTLLRDSSEVAWNDGPGDSHTSGGGISQFFPVPEFQKGIKLPPSANKDNKEGRGAPDVAGNASPMTGYVIRVHGTDTIMGGTSAVAPLYAALMMRVNGALGQPAGYLNPFLYKKGMEGSDIFRDITKGKNNGYDAGPGWDAVTGWGSINGSKFLDALKKEQELKKAELEKAELEKAQEKK